MLTVARPEPFCSGGLGWVLWTSSAQQMISSETTKSVMKMKNVPRSEVALFSASPGGGGGDGGSLGGHGGGGGCVGGGGGRSQTGMGGRGGAAGRSGGGSTGGGRFPFARRARRRSAEAIAPNTGRPTACRGARIPVTSSRGDCPFYSRVWLADRYSALADSAPVKGVGCRRAFSIGCRAASAAPHWMRRADRLCVASLTLYFVRQWPDTKGAPPLYLTPLPNGSFPWCPPD